MKNLKISNLKTKSAIAGLFLLSLGYIANAADQPFTVKSDLFDQTNTNTLGLPTAAGIETITVFTPNDSTDKFCNGIVMTHFKDKFYCQWQSSALNEDAPETKVVFSTSEDGKTWTAPKVLAATLENGYSSSGGWWSNEDTLVAYINTWPAAISPRGGFTRYTTSTDGINWSELKPLLMANGDTLQGIFEQDPHALPNGRIVNAAHFQPGLTIAPIYTDDATGVRGWKRATFTNMPFSGSISREIEPSSYIRNDNSLVMIFRDQNSTFRKLAATSSDNGESWTTPVMTNMPDARTKQSAGNIGDSISYFVGNPVTNKLRLPLAITLSKDGFNFNTAYLLRASDNIQSFNYTGTAKRAGYHYPKTMLWDNKLYISYATNKEDVEFTTVPISSLVIEGNNTSASAIADKNQIEISLVEYGFINITTAELNGVVDIYTISGKVIYSGEINGGAFRHNMSQHPKGVYIIDIKTNNKNKAVKYLN